MAHAYIKCVNITQCLTEWRHSLKSSCIVCLQYHSTGNTQASAHTKTRSSCRGQSRPRPPPTCAPPPPGRTSPPIHPCPPTPPHAPCYNHLPGTCNKTRPWCMLLHKTRASLTSPYVFAANCPDRVAGGLSPSCPVALTHYCICSPLAYALQSDTGWTLLLLRAGDR